MIFMQVKSAEIKVNARDILTLSTNKYADCGDKDTIYVDYANITEVIVTILSQLLILICVLGLVGWLTGIC